MQNFSQKETARMKAEVFILDWLIMNRVGAHQTTFERMVRRVPPDKKYGNKASREALKNLIRKGFISVKRKHYDLQISLLYGKIDDAYNYARELERRISVE